VIGGRQGACSLALRATTLLILSVMVPVANLTSYE
jgi:hypothetical protein